MFKSPRFILLTAFAIVLLACSACGSSNTISGLEETLIALAVEQTRIAANQPAADPVATLAAPLPATPTPQPLPTATAMPRTVRVMPDGTGDFPTIQDAIANLEDGATIILGAGTYTLTDTLRISKSVTIEGAGSNETIITSASADGVLIFSGPGNIILQGISFEYQGTAEANVMTIENGIFDIRACRFSKGVHNEEEEIGGNGLLIHGNSDGVIKNCWFNLNQLNGLAITDQSYALIESSTFRNNNAYGLGFWEQSSGEVRDCASELNAATGFSVQDEVTVIFENNTAKGNTDFGFKAYDNASVTANQNDSFENGLGGFAVDQTAQLTAENNIARDNVQSGFIAFENATLIANGNEIYNNKLHGISIQEQAKGYLENNTIYNNAEVGIRAAENTYIEARSNNIYGNNLSGIIITGQAEGILENNTLNNNLEAAICFFSSAKGSASGNQCSGNKWGIYLENTASPSIGNNPGCPIN